MFPYVKHAMMRRKAIKEKEKDATLQGRKNIISFVVITREIAIIFPVLRTWH